MWGVPVTHLSLEEYWATLTISECAGYGIRSVPGAITGFGCGDYWNQSERYWVAFAMAKSEQRLLQNRWLGFPLRRQYFTREFPYGWPLDVNMGWVRCVGAETETLVGAQALTLSVGPNINDPVTFNIAVTFTDPDELVIYYPSQNPRKYLIRPSKVTISGGVASVEIPRCRLLKPAYFINFANNQDRPSYTDDNNFLSTVDVYRNYCRPPGTNLAWIRHAPNCGCYDLLPSGGICNPTAPCGETLQYACGYVRDQKHGFVQLEPVTVADDGSFTKASYSVHRRPDKVQIQFMAGWHDRYDELDEDLVRALIALTHNNMMDDYCSCSVVQRYYKRDTNSIEPPVQLGLGPSTWGILEASQIVKERRVFSGGFV